MGGEEFVGEEGAGGGLVLDKILALLAEVACENCEFLTAWLAAEGELAGAEDAGFESAGDVAQKAGC